MKVVELISRLVDEPLMNDVLICTNVVGGDFHIADVELVFENTKNQFVLYGEYKEKRETGFEPVPQDNCL